MIECFNRTLKTRIWKSFTASHNREWKDNLSKFISGYNNTIHSTIGIPPANMNKENASEIWMKVYSGNYAKFPIPKFRIGDIVRLRRYKELKQGGKGLNVNRALVKWEGFDDSHNTWIPFACIENIDPRFEGKSKGEVIKRGIKV